MNKFVLASMMTRDATFLDSEPEPEINLKLHTCLLGAQRTWSSSQLIRAAEESRTLSASPATLAELTGMDPAEAAILLDAAGGDMEMAVSLHFGDPADAELYWGGEELVARGGAKPGVAQKLLRESSLVRCWTEVFCAHVAAARESPLRATRPIHEVLGPGSNALVFLMLCSAVCKHWRQAVCDAMPALRELRFSGYELVRAPNVLTALARVAGGNLATVDLARCRWLSAKNIEKILARVASTCPRVAEIDLQGCSVEAQLRALAVRTRVLCDAASPRTLFEFIAALQEDGDTRCPLERLSDLRNNLLAQGRWSLVLDLIPRYWLSRRQNSALRNKARERGGAWDIAVLLGVSFPGGQQGARQIFDCDEKDAVSGQRAVHFAAELGDEALLEVLISAGANLNVKDGRGLTPLMLSAMKGHRKVVRALLSNGADPALTDRAGDTALMLACENKHEAAAAELMEATKRAGALDLQGELGRSDRRCTWPVKRAWRARWRSCWPLARMPTLTDKTAERPCGWRARTSTRQRRGS